MNSPSAAATIHPYGYKIKVSGERGKLVQYMCGYVWLFGGTKVSLMARGLVHLSRLGGEPALSLVPEARLPPKGWRETMDPVGLSLM